MTDYQGEHTTDFPTRKRKISSPFPSSGDETKCSKGSPTTGGIFANEVDDTGGTHQPTIHLDPLSTSSATLPQQNATQARTTLSSNDALPPSLGVHDGSANDSSFYTSGSDKHTGIAAALGVEALKADLTSKLLLAYAQEQAKQQEKAKQQISELAKSIVLAQPPSTNLDTQRRHSDEYAKTDPPADARERSAPLDLLTAAIRQLQEQQSQTSKQNLSLGTNLATSQSQQSFSSQTECAPPPTSPLLLPVLGAPPASEAQPRWPPQQQQQRETGKSSTHSSSSAPNLEPPVATTHEDSSAALHLLLWKPSHEPLVPAAATNTAPYQLAGSTGGLGIKDSMQGERRATETSSTYPRDKIRLLNESLPSKRDHSPRGIIASAANGSGESFTAVPPVNFTPEPTTVTSTSLKEEVGDAVEDTSIGSRSQEQSSFARRAENCMLPHAQQPSEEGKKRTSQVDANPSLVLSAHSLRDEQLLPKDTDMTRTAEEQSPSIAKMTRLERKKFREKQRRLDLHEGFRQLKETMVRIDPSSWTEGATADEDCEEGSLSTSRKAQSGGGADDEGADGDPAAMNRVELLRRAVLVLERINAESEEHKSLTARLSSQLEETENALSQVVSVFNTLVSNQQGAIPSPDSATQPQLLQPQNHLQLALARALLASQEGTRPFPAPQAAPTSGLAGDIAAALGVGAVPFSANDAGSLLLQSLVPPQMAATTNANSFHVLAALASQSLPTANPSSSALLLGLLGSLGQPKG